MKNLKSTKGFTLVELIVVIAILGILAAVAVPAYSGYVTKANEAADYTQLDAVKTAAVAAYTETQIKKGNANTDVTKMFVDITSEKVYVNPTAATASTGGTDVTSAMATYYTMNKDAFKSGAVSASWTSGGSWTLNKS